MYKCKKKEHSGLDSQVTVSWKQRVFILTANSCYVLCLMPKSADSFSPWGNMNVNIHPETNRFLKKGGKIISMKWPLNIILEYLGNFRVECPLLSMIEQLVPNNMVYLIREILDLIMQHISEIIMVTLSQWGK